MKFDVFYRAPCVPLNKDSLRFSFSSREERKAVFFFKLRCWQKKLSIPKICQVPFVLIYKPLKHRKKQKSGPKRGSKNRYTAIGNAKNAYKIGRNRGITKIVIPWTHQGIIKNTLGILKRDEMTTFFIN